MTAITLFAHKGRIAVRKAKTIAKVRKIAQPKKRAKPRAKNPVKHGYTIAVAGAEIATFKTRMHAVQYGQALANATGKTVSMRK